MSIPTNLNIAAVSYNNVSIPLAGGGGGPELITSITVTAQRSVQVNIDSSWFNTYDFVVIVPNVTASASDWMYVVPDATSGGNYTNKNTTFGKKGTTILFSSNSKIAFTIELDRLNGYASSYLSSYLYYYMYTSTITMTGTFDIYGITM